MTFRKRFIHVQFIVRLVDIVLDNRSDSARLVDVRPGILERAIGHDIACFSRDGCVVDRVRDFSGVDSGCHRLVSESVHNVLDMACEIYLILGDTPFPPARVLNGQRKVTIRRTRTF